MALLQSKRHTDSPTACPQSRFKPDRTLVGRDLKEACKTAAELTQAYHRVMALIDENLIDVNQLFHEDLPDSTYTPLSYVLKHQCLGEDFIDFLIEKGADVNKCSTDITESARSGFKKVKLTPLHWSMKLPVEVRVNIGKKLIGAGADVNSYTGSMVIGEEEGLSMKYHTNYTHLHCAILESKPYDLVAMLLEEGANVTIEKDGRSLLHDAIDHGEDMLILLVKYGCISHTSSPLAELLQQKDHNLPQKTMVIKHLLHAGYNVREDFHHNTELYLDPTTDMNKQMCKDWICKPLMLMESCRITIRRLTGACKPSGFYFLPVTVYLQKYLALEIL